MMKARRGNLDVKRRKVIKWEFYSVLTEELMTYVDIQNEEDSFCRSTNKQLTSRIMNGHTAAPYFSFSKLSIAHRHLCMVCSMDEMAKAQVLKLPANKIRNQKFSRRTKYLVKCMHEDCSIHTHTCVSDESKVAQLPYFQGLTCFEIAHHPQCKGLFTRIKHKGKFYSRTVPSHSIVQEVKDLYKSTLPRRSTRERNNRLRAGRPPTTILTTDGRNNDEIESISNLTSIETTPETFTLTNTPPQDQEQPRRQLYRRKKISQQLLPEEEQQE